MAGELLKVGGETVQRKFEYLQSAPLNVHSLSNMNSTTPAQDLSPTQNLSVGSSLNGEKQEILHMRALFVSNGVPAFWMTINPADTPHHGLIDSGLI
jgi:hypothetical protein